jgi:hypothetical protein
VTGAGRDDAERLYLIAADDEVGRRRSRLSPGRVVETWPDAAGGAFWVGAQSKAALDAAGDTPLAAAVSLPAACVEIYYGPQLCDVESLPLEESLRARVVSARGMAVAWATLDRFGQRSHHEPQSPADPIFYLRRPGGATSHLWRLFRTRTEAIAFMAELHGADSEGSDWARALALDDFDTLLSRHARAG